jgi:hypothetical protein
MSHPYNAGRDSNVGGGHAFGDESGVADSHVSAASAEAFASHPNRLGEADYRSPDQHA